MKNLSVMIKPASALCDMRCAYCFYNKAPLGVMSREVASAMIKNIFCELESGDHITFAFQGGEPGLAGLDYFTFFVEEVNKAKVAGIKTHYAFQTNGLMINEDWCRFFKANKFLIGLSLDGDSALHNKNRMDSKGKGTFSRVMKAKTLLDRFKVDYNILCVLTAESARRANKIWDFVLREKIGYIQFIPCLEPLGEKDKNALTGAKFYQFYSSIFPLWKREAEKGNLIVIRFFEDLAAMLLAGQPTTCGLSGGCRPQIIVEADGNVYPCDFYVLEEYRVGNFTDNNIREIFEAIVAGDFLKDSGQRPISQACMDCPHSRWCRGGCRRMSNAVYGDPCGMRLFLDECLNDLIKVYRAAMQ